MYTIVKPTIPDCTNGYISHIQCLFPNSSRGLDEVIDRFVAGLLMFVASPFSSAAPTKYLDNPLLIEE
jgi:hypothetical protein